MILSITKGVPIHAQWLEGYYLRAHITVDEGLVPGTAPLNEFPLLFTFTDTLLRSTLNGGYVVYSDGRDIVFTDKDSTTILDYEIEHYDPVTGSIVAWIRIPSVSADQQTDFFLYYGHLTGNPLGNPSAVWSNQYTAVWHMNDDPSDPQPQISDATSFINHGTTGGDMTAEDQVDGKISGAIRFDGVDDYVLMPDSGFNTGEGSVELWINLDSIPEINSDYIFAHRQEDPISDRVYVRVWDSGEWGSGMGDTYDLVRGSTVGTGSWHHMALSWENSELTGYLDGAQDFGPVPFTALDTVREIYVMTWMPSSESTSGTLDELRVSAVARDSSWLVASYRNQSDPQSHYQVHAHPVNDMPCDALPLEIGASCNFEIHSNLGAGSSGVPDPGCGSYDGGDIWFYVIVPDTGSFEIQTDTEADFQYPFNNGWMYRAAMALYSGTCDALELMDCYENNGSYHPRMAGAQVTGQTPGDTIWVRIWENSFNDIGMVKICVTELDVIPCASLYQVSGGGAFCTGDTGVAIILNGSESGYRYALVMNDTITLDTLMGTWDTLIWYPVAEPGIYTVKAWHPSDTCVMIMEDSAVVIQYDIPGLSFATENVTCYGLENGSIVTTITGGSEPYEAMWSGSGGFSSTQIDLTGLSPGTYSITVTDHHGCVGTGPELAITEPALLEITLGQITHLTSYDANDGKVDISLAGGTPPYSVSWTGTDGYVSSDPDPTGMTVGYYEVRVTDDHLCGDSIQSIAVSVEEDASEVFIPEGFSPNGDGYNDRFVILGIEQFPENELVVFNRQGVEIYHRVNYANEWDGRPEMGGVLGGTLPEGTYYYVFTYGEGLVRKGFIYLNRE